MDSKPLIKQKHQLEPPHQAEVIGTTVASCLVSEWSGAVSDELSAPPDLEVIATVVLLT